jgi:hypothetical protein
MYLGRLIIAVVGANNVNGFMRAMPLAKSNRPLHHLPTGIEIDFIAYVSVDVSFSTRVAAVMARILQMYLVRKHGLLLAGLQVPAGLDLGTRAWSSG